jgi:siroheme synthase-like protein
VADAGHPGSRHGGGNDGRHDDGGAEPGGPEAGRRDRAWRARRDGASAALWPVFLRLEGRRVLVVGGGAVAAGRIAPLLAAGASITVVSPSVVPGLAAAPVRLERRPFRPSDLDEVWIAVAAATPEVNREVAEAAAERRVFVNAVDDPESASVYTGGVVRRGGFTIAVSTEGRAPALAGLFREALEVLIPDDSTLWVALAERLRREQRLAGIPLADRRPLLLDALQRLYDARSSTTANSERDSVAAAAR